jgi:hypothetical protein
MKIDKWKWKMRLMSIYANFDCYIAGINLLATEFFIMKFEKHKIKKITPYHIFFNDNYYCLRGMPYIQDDNWLLNSAEDRSAYFKQESAHDVQ